MKVAIQQQQAGGTIAPHPGGEWTRQEVIDLIVQKAGQYGLIDWEFLGGAIAESALDPHAVRYGTWPDVSFGLYQQTVKYADEGDHTDSPENVAYIRDLYFDPVHACDVAAVKFKYWRYNPDVPALTAWCAYNWPGSYHTPEQNPNIGNYRSSLTKAKELLGTGSIGTERVYAGNVPDSVTLQQNNWSCAVRSTYAALWMAASLGKIAPVSYGDGGPRDVYDLLVPRYDDASVGLHNHTGTGIVEALGTWGIRASSRYPTSLAGVQAIAGLKPVMIGGRRWNHWVCVRGVESDGTLILENPMPGFGGIYHQLRDSFARLGDDNGMMSMVWIDV